MLKWENTAQRTLTCFVLEEMHNIVDTAKTAYFIVFKKKKKIYVGGQTRDVKFKEWWKKACGGDTIKTNQQEFGKIVGACYEDNVPERGKWHRKELNEKWMHWYVAWTGKWKAH